MVTVTNRKRTYEFDLGYMYMYIYRCAIADVFGVSTEYRKELRLNKYVQSIWDARKIHAEKQGARVVRVASVSGNKKTLELLLGCQIG